MSSLDSDFSWNSTGIETIKKFVQKFWDYSHKIKIGKSDEHVQSKINKSIKEITEEIENLRYKSTIIKMRFLLDYLYDKEISKSDYESFIKIFSVFAPHIAEELWHNLGNKNFISLEKWPGADEKKINEKFEKEEKLIEDIIGDVNNVLNIVRGRGKNVSKLYLYVLPNEFGTYTNNLQDIKKRTNLEVKIFQVNDKNKHDPGNKSKKVKPGKPGIYLE